MKKKTDLRVRTDFLLNDPQVVNNYYVLNRKYFSTYPVFALGIRSRPMRTPQMLAKLYGIQQHTLPWHTVAALFISARSLALVALEAKDAIRRAALVATPEFTPDVIADGGWELVSGVAENEADAAKFDGMYREIALKAYGHFTRTVFPIFDGSFINDQAEAERRMLVYVRANDLLFHHFFAIMNNKKLKAHPKGALEFVLHPELIQDRLTDRIVTSFEDALPNLETDENRAAFAKMLAEQEANCADFNEAMDAWIEADARREMHDSRKSAVESAVALIAKRVAMARETDLIETSG